MDTDLKSLSRKELEKLLEDVKKALQKAQDRDRREARKAAEKAAAGFGFSLGELNDEAKPPKVVKKRTKPSVAKYANPADKSQTWTGKGRQPNWYREQLAKGVKPEALEI